MSWELITHSVVGVTQTLEHEDELKAAFASPPNTARPRVWWHWLNGNITKQGIQQDLEWMQRVGLGGLQNFDAAFNTPKLVEQRLEFMTPSWKDAFNFTAHTADRLGLELSIAGSPGWSESGGPWVKPEEGMKKLVWSETRVEGGTAFTGRLPQPPSTLGPFQDVQAVWGLSTFAGPAPLKPVTELYRDIAVVAYRLPAVERSMPELHPKITSSAGAVEAALLWDGRFKRAVHLPYLKSGEPAWIQFDFGRPRAIQSMTLGLEEFDGIVLLPKQIGAELQASSDGKTFRRVAIAYDSGDFASAMPPVEQTVTFDPVTARYFRLLVFPLDTSQLSKDVAALLPPIPSTHRITELVLHTAPRVNHFEEKAGYFLNSSLDAHPTPEVVTGDTVDPGEVLDLTAKLHADGTFDWTVPPGRWAVLRIGYSLLGIMNHPASPEGTGLEVDKLSRAAVKAYMDQYLERYRSMLGASMMGAHGLRAMVHDSYEAGPENWTDELPREFARRRGYDLMPWLPALMGRILGSASATDRFLWDYRRTLEELLAENHYDQTTAILHSHSMIHYGESHEVRRAFLGDGMDAKRSNDVPMAAMWVPVRGYFITQKQGDADIRESASVAHIYGQNRVAAESMTAFGTADSAYVYAPENLKPTADRELADGLNLFVIHTSTHQPLDSGPGVTLGPFGQWFTRHETWAELAGPWVTYLARSSYLLQQGHFVADIVYYYGQDSNITALYGEHLPDIPSGYSFDFASSHALTMLSVSNGRLVTSSGMSYRVLALDPRARLMSLDVLDTLARLIEAGATVVGDKPESTPSLSDDITTFKSLVDRIWGNGSRGEHLYGAGKVICGESLAQAVANLKVTPDFSYLKPSDDMDVWFVHRQLPDGELYFLNNRQDRPKQIEARFRVVGRAPEIWHADSGAIEPASYSQEKEYTLVPLVLDAHDAVFVVFRKPTQERERRIAEPVRHPLRIINGPWELHFQSGRGAPESATFAQLESWSANADSGIKYFSGTASYETTFEAPKSWLVSGQQLEVDLGNVKNIAEVLINGEPVTTVWKAPFRANVTGLVRAGVNQLIVRVTNLWPNRLIGDKQPGVKPVASTTLDPYNADSPLLESGLLGPVMLVSVNGGDNLMKKE